jgi:hypothetical protein
MLAVEFSTGITLLYCKKWSDVQSHLYLLYLVSVSYVV